MTLQSFTDGLLSAVWADLDRANRDVGLGDGRHVSGELFAPVAERVARVLSRDELERFGIDAPLLDIEALQRYRGGPREGTERQSS